MTNQAIADHYKVSARQVTRWRKDGDPRVDIDTEKVDIAPMSTPNVDIPPPVSTFGVDISAKVDIQGRHYPPADNRFETRGRGVPVNGMVKVNFGGSDDRMVPEDVWRARLEKRCVHNFLGWACTKCLI